MLTTLSSVKTLHQFVPAGSPLFGTPQGELMSLPLFVLFMAVKAKSVTYGPALMQIRWSGTLDGEPVVVVWHVRDSRGMVAHNSALRVVTPKDLYGVLKRMSHKKCSHTLTH